jgi:hypothetical protein
MWHGVDFESEPRFFSFIAALTEFLQFTRADLTTNDCIRLFWPPCCSEHRAQAQTA